ncbi:MAG: class I SAM-dependent methyltransferase [Clostridium argentinense]|uniref:class I SAM-dependent methyltransferase n=1 Tax=Clostridium butanoliproducens TaxID=2991837 RepID=UPI001DC787BE|nr:class I SAM-dependent methyltransferase [Clostridium butanoliproducens]MBS5825076.1 class I SAM-dependent methyltransferase [Clostridium argentinense]MDU1348382.1 class I SAM-dependent methyltransferase [Clostridium argentinense]
MDIIKHNSKAWDGEVKAGNIWTKPVTSEIIEDAKKGEWGIYLTPTKKVPREWFGDLNGKKVLCLASGGGQQGHILSAAGAEVTVFDNSKEQLKGDEYVAEREGFNIKTIQGDMRDLSYFEDEKFDLIVHPISNIFVDDILVVWKEAARVLKNNGTLVSGISNPINYIFDYKKLDKGIFEVKYSIPYSDLENLSKEEMDEFIEKNYPFEFGHTLEDQIKGQIDAGFVITGFYEDTYGGKSALDKYINTYIATRAVKTNIE